MSETTHDGTIIVASDFSDHAANALRFAIELARSLHARIRIIHAVDVVTIPHPSLDVQRMVRKGLDELDAIAADSGIEVASSYATGHPWEIVAETAREHRADLVVIGTRGRGKGSWRLGRTADRILRVAPAPVVAVPPGARPGPVHRILVGTDFSSCAAEALAVARRLAVSPVSASIALLHAWRPLVDYELGPVGGVPAVIDDGGAAASAQIAALAAELRDEGLEVETLVREGPPATEILDAAKALNVDLIALGTHGHTGLAHLLLGSIAERVVHQATVPVVTVGLAALGERAQHRRDLGVTSP